MNKSEEQNKDESLDNVLEDMLKKIAEHPKYKSNPKKIEMLRQGITSLRKGLNV